MSLNELRIGDRIIDPSEEQSPSNGYEIVGIDRQGMLKTGPGVVCTWDGRPPTESFRLVKVKELVRFQSVRRG